MKFIKRWCRSMITNVKVEGFCVFLITFTMFFAIFCHPVSASTLDLSSAYVDARPSIQLSGKYVNITFIPPGQIDTKYVYVHITFPDGTSQTKNMISSSGKYVYNSSYLKNGKFTFYIDVEDQSGNKGNTSKNSFWITEDLEDIDNDGMPNWWEEKYGLDPFDPDDAEKDADGDGYSNVEEYKMDMNPNKKASILQVAIYELKDNWPYFIASCLFFIAILLMSLYGIKRRKKYELD